MICSVARPHLDRSPRCMCSANARACLMRPLAFALISQMSQFCEFPLSQIVPEMPAVHQMSIFRPLVRGIGNRRAPGFDTEGMAFGAHDAPFHPVAHNLPMLYGPAEQ
jgi:hypothetical protein